MAMGNAHTTDSLCFKEGLAHFDEVGMLAINHVNARTNALRTVSIDYMNKVALKTVYLDISTLSKARGTENPWLDEKLPICKA